MHQDVPRLNCSAIILAGGKATRMGGVDKPLVEFSGKPLIRRVIDIVEPLFEQIIIACGREEHYCNISGTVGVFDEIPGQGPLAGLLAGLKVCSTEWAFVVAGDMPFLNSDLIRRIMNKAIGSDASLVIPRHAEFIEPLHAAYRRSLIDEIEKCLAARKRRMAALAESVEAIWFDVNDEDPQIFYNINSADDLIRAEHSFNGE